MAHASAVTEFGYQRDVVNADKEADALNERLGFFAHELRNQLCTATLALSIIKEGNVGLSGATGGVLDRALVGLSNLIDRSLAEVRMTAGIPLRHRLISLANFIAEIKLSASLEAQVRGCTFTVSDVDPLLSVDVDRDLLLAATGNLLQNAFKFTQPHSEVSLDAYALADRIRIDVKDHCGGLPPGFAGEMFKPFQQAAGDRSGLGLGLSIARRIVEANNGILRVCEFFKLSGRPWMADRESITQVIDSREPVRACTGLATEDLHRMCKSSQTLSVRDVPGTGCVFTIDLPRQLPPKTAAAAPPVKAVGIKAA